MRRTAARLAVLVALLGVPGCTAGDGAPAAGSSPPAAPVARPVPGVDAEVVQLRTDAAVGGRVQVRLTNTGDRAVTVASWALDSAGFAPRPPVDDEADLAPGRVVDLPTPYGPPRCGSAAEPAAARMILTRDGGAPERVELPLAAEALDRIHAEECAALDLAATVAVEVAELAPSGRFAAGELTLTRRSGDEEIRVVRLARSVLVDVEADLPVVLPVGRSEVAVPVRFTPATCEPHVLAETKQPFVFPLAVEVGGADAVPLDLPLSDDVRGQLAGLVDRVCSARGE